MAKIYGINGTLRGRQGNNVYSVQNGTQVVKAYQPAVFNPRTFAQREQRAKMSLAGKMSAVTPSLALQGFTKGNARSNRAAFVSHILRMATVSGSVDALVASVPYEKVLYSIGNVPVVSVDTVVTAAYQAGGSLSRLAVTVSALSLPTGAPANYGEMVVVAVYDDNTSMVEAVQYQRRVVGSPTLFYFYQGRQRAVHIATYIVPFISMNANAAPLSGNLGDSETDITLSVDSSVCAANSEFGQSLFVSSIAVAPTQALHAPEVEDDATRVSSRKLAKN